MFSSDIVEETSESSNNYEEFYDVMKSRLSTTEKLDVMKKMIKQQGINVNIEDPCLGLFGSILFYALACRLDVQIIEFLLSVGANPNYRIRDRHNGKLGISPIIQLILHFREYEYVNEDKIARVLIYYGADIKVETKDGKCALDLLRDHCSELDEHDRRITSGELNLMSVLVHETTFLYRLPYLSLTEGCPQEKSHIGRYLFNELVCRDICTFLFEEFWN